MFEIPNLHRLTTSRLRRFVIPYLHRFHHPEIDNIFTQRSLIRLSFSDITWKLISWTSANSTFRGWKVFPEFPNTSPSGKRVDSDDLFPRKLLNSGKKRHPRNVRVDTRPPENSQRSNRGEFLKLPPLAPINRELSLWTFFTASPFFSELLVVISPRRFFASKGLKTQGFVNFWRYYFSVTLFFLLWFKLINYILSTFICEKLS
jgi:hypothetical protein